MRQRTGHDRTHGAGIGRRGGRGRRRAGGDDLRAASIGQRTDKLDRRVSGTLIDRRVLHARDALQIVLQKIGLAQGHVLLRNTEAKPMLGFM